MELSNGNKQNPSRARRLGRRCNLKETLKAIMAMLLLIPMGLAILLAYCGAIIARCAMQILGVWEGDE